MLLKLLAGNDDIRFGRLPDSLRCINEGFYLSET